MSSFRAGIMDVFLLNLKTLQWEIRKIHLM